MGGDKLIRRESMETIPQLPEDVVLNILSRLPVKYLIQLKCVCKPWSSFISSPQFAKLHLARSKNNNSLGCHRFLLLSGPYEIVHCEDSVDDLDLPHVSHFEFPVGMKKIPGFDYKLVGDFKVGGCCDGLICVVFSNSRLFVCNPTIREAMELTNNSGSNYYTIFGMGYDSSIDDYKVLRRVHHRHQPFTLPGKIIVDYDFEFLALKSNIWRKLQVEECKLDYYFRELPGLFLRGALHWLAHSPYDVKTKSVPDVLVFDMVKEKFCKLVELPDSIVEGKFELMILTNIGDDLFLFCGNIYSVDLEAWQLNEYGVKSSWTKMFSKLCPIPDPYIDYWGIVLHCTKTGKIILGYGECDFAWYGTKEDTWETFCPPQIDLQWFETAFYEESLVLPDWYRPISVENQ